MSPGPLVAVLSIPRSGTNALGSLMVAGSPGLIWEREFFIGAMSPRTRRDLAASYPWVLDVDPARRSAAAPAQRQEMARAYRKRMSADGVKVLSTALEGRREPTALKLFREHLARDTVDDLLRSLRPHVVLLRRRMVFSYLSLLKADAVDSWADGDTTDARPVLSDRAVADYVEGADEWAQWSVSAVERWRLPSVTVTYEGLFDTGADLAALRDFLSTVPGARVVDDLARWAASTAIQDRRTDGALSAVATEFARLSRASREALLRHPGDASPGGRRRKVGDRGDR